MHKIEDSNFAAIEPSSKLRYGPNPRGFTINWILSIICHLQFKIDFTNIKKTVIVEDRRVNCHSSMAVNA